MFRKGVGTWILKGRGTWYESGSSLPLCKLEEGLSFRKRNCVEKRLSCVKSSVHQT